MLKRIIGYLVEKTSENKEVAGAGSASLLIMVVFAYQTFVTQADFQSKVKSYDEQIIGLRNQLKLQEYELALHGIIVPLNLQSTKSVIEEKNIELPKSK